MLSDNRTEIAHSNRSDLLPQQPLQIAVTPLGRLHQPLCALLRQIVPALQAPETVPLSFRQKLAQEVLAFLEEEGGEDPYSDRLADEEDELCSEPGE